MLRYSEQKISGWGRYPAPESCRVVRPDMMREIELPEDQFIARGLGRSYGDAAMNRDRYVISMERLNRFLAFDGEHGIVTVEAGVTLEEVLEYFIPRGWFLPVTPGTKYVTVGGCVACDVHGKNHHRDGSFGEHVNRIKLMLADGSIVKCGPKEHPEIFWATVGGMGLTGLILEVTFRLIPIRSSFMNVCYRLTQNLDDTLKQLKEADEENYSVAWIDGFSPGRGVLMFAEHASFESLEVRNTDPITLPWGAMGKCFNPYSMRVFNMLYYFLYRNKQGRQIIDYNHYFYPLDGVNQWNRIYGKKGFLQYQCVFPHDRAKEGIQTLLSQGLNPYLIVIKCFGKGNPGYLSFPMEGVTIAMDLPNQGPTLFEKLKRLDRVVLGLGGRIYLAKDACLEPEVFERMYPRLEEWLKVKESVDPQWRIQSDLSKRLFRRHK